LYDDTAVGVHEHAIAMTVRARGEVIVRALLTRLDAVGH
jgi:hypothetical protein